MAKLATLMYHAISNPITADKRRYACPPKRFKEQLQRVISEGFKFVDAPTAIQGLRGSGFADDSVLVTFDDGYLDNWTDARPILESLQIPALFFITSRILNSKGGEGDIAEFVDSQMMESDHIKSLKTAGFAIGSHSATHARLTEIDDESLAVELNESKSRIEEILEAPIEGFAYPYGARNERVIDAVKKAGYEYAFSTKGGFSSAQDSLFDIRRIEVCGFDSPSKLVKKLSFGGSDLSVISAAKYYMKRARARFKL